MYFKVGMNNKGYRTSCHAKLQLEDVVNCLTNIYIHDFIFLYDQSFSHTKMREDSFIGSIMNATYGAVVSTMHNTSIHEIRPFSNI